MDRADREHWKAKDVARLLSLVEAERRYFQEMTSALPVGMAVLARDLTFASTNRAFRALFGLGAEALQAQSLEDVGLPDTIRPLAQKSLADSLSRETIVRDMATPNGLRNVRITLKPFRDWDEQADNELLMVAEDFTSVVDFFQASQYPALFWKADFPPTRFLEVHNAGSRPSWSAGADFFSSGIHASDLPFVREFYRSLKPGASVWSCDYRSTGEGGEEIWLRDLITLESGKDSIYGLTIDVTQSRRREEAAQQSAKVEALGRLAASFAHEGNNLLQIIGIQGEDLIRSLPADHPLRANVQEILTASHRLKELTDRAAAYAEPGKAQPVPVALDEWLSELSEQLPAVIPSTIHAEFKTGAPACFASADPQMLRRAAQTLVRRAVEGMGGSGRITVETVPVVITSSSAAEPAEMPAGEYLCLRILDSGGRIEPDAMGQIWEPVPPGADRAANVAQIYSTIRDMGGWIFAANEPKAGTRFEIYLRRTTAARQSQGRGETILVVDDESSIRSLMRKILEREGYRALEAANGNAALELARQETGEIDLLVSDIVMPEMTGFMLAEELSAVRPGIKVLFMSGYTGISGFNPAELPSGSAFLQKPFSLEAFLKKVRELLGQSAKAAGA